MTKGPRAAGVAAAFCLCMALFLLSDDFHLQTGQSPLTRRFLLDSSPFASTDKKVWPNSERARRMIGEATQFDPSTVHFPDSEHPLKKTHPWTASSNSGITKLQLPETIDSLPQAIIDETVDSDSDHFLFGCDATSAIRVDTSSNPWILTSLNTVGQVKTYGGDEYYITYSIDALTPSPDAVARIVDRNDGSYSLYFLESRSPLRKRDANMKLAADIGTGNQFGVLSVNLISTCATSFLDPPGKAGWTADGSINVVWKKGGVVPPLYGYFNELPRQFPELISKYDYVYAVGNSLMKNFASKCYLKKDCEHIAKEDWHRLEGRAGWRRNIVYSNGLGVPLNTRTVKTHFLPRISRGVDLQKDGEAKNHFAPIPDDRTAFILGSCVWDVASHYDMKTFDNSNGTISSRRFGFFELDDHLTAIRFYISEIRRLHPKREIFWKGCTALHRHVLSRESQSKIPKEGLDSVFYCRSEKINGRTSNSCH